MRCAGDPLRGQMGRQWCAALHWYVLGRSVECRISARMCTGRHARACTPWTRWHLGFRCILEVQRAGAPHLLVRYVSLSCQACSFQARLGLVSALSTEGRFTPVQLDTGKPPAGQMSSTQTLCLETKPNVQAPSGPGRPRAFVPLVAHTVR